AHIDHDIAHRAAQYAYELALRLGMLKVQAAQRAAHRTRQVVLDERLRDADARITLHLKRLRKEAARVAKYLWLDDQYARNGSLDDLHVADDDSRKRPRVSRSATASESEDATSTANSWLRNRVAAACSSSSARGKMRIPPASPAALPAARSEAR